MTANAVLAVLGALRRLGVAAVVDGGWGVDALVGRQTRPHDDLDLVIDRADLPAVVEALRADGYAVERDLLPTAIAYRHPDGRAVDLHPVDPVPGGGGDQVLETGERWRYGPPVTGRIGGEEVACCSIETQLAAHEGYEPDDDDRADVAALRELLQRP